MIEQVALADSTNRITLAELPKPPKAPTLPSDGVVDETKPAVNAEEEDDDDDDEDLKIVDQFKVKGKKKGDNWVGLEMVDRSVHRVLHTPAATDLCGLLTDCISRHSGILSTTSSGLLTLNPHSSTSSTTTTKSAKLPSGLKVAQSLGSSGDKIVVAGKEVDVSIYDTERVFAAGIDGADGVSGTGGKRKKGEMEVGEIWRAKAVSPVRCSLTSGRESASWKADYRRNPRTASEQSPQSPSSYSSSLYDPPPIFSRRIQFDYNVHRDGYEIGSCETV